MKVKKKNASFKEHLQIVQQYKNNNMPQWKHQHEKQGSMNKLD